MLDILDKYYDEGCIIVAFVLFLYTKPIYKHCSLISLIEFLACWMAFLLGIKLSSLLEYHLIYQAYFFIQLAALYSLLHLYLKGLELGWLIFIVIGVMAICNAFTVSTYFEYSIFGYSPIEVYNIYQYLFRALMLLQLLSMLSYVNLGFKGNARDDSIPSNIHDRRSDWRFRWGAV